MIKAVIFDMFETLITHFECPLYFSTQMAADAGISEESFRSMWNTTDAQRTLGQMTFEEAIEEILVAHGKYTKELFTKIVEKRVFTKEECFRHLHKEILPMLQKLKEEGYLVGLISNCFSEEAPVIRKSVLFPYFDQVCLSYEEGVRKPDSEIYDRCMEKLGVKAEECVYVGDGGSSELEAARALGMHEVQAVWYFKAGTLQPCGKKDGFVQMESPLGLVEYVKTF